MLAELTPLGISVLALLNEAPMHAYEMYQLLLKRKEDRVVKIRPGSLYHTVERLAGQRLVEAVGTDRAGNRPERTTYAITAEGRTALVQRITDALEVPAKEYPIFPLALSESHTLSADDAVAKFRNRIAALEAEIEDLRDAIAEARAEGVQEAYWFTADFMITQLGSERDWIRTTIERIESKDLEWPYQPKPSNPS